MALHAAAEVEPTPPPGSDERSISERRRMEALIERHAHARSMDELPSELRNNPIIRGLVSMTPAEEAQLRASMDARREAEALYGDDVAAELAAIEAGTHPLHRLATSAR